jgi:hypothetical protein
LTVPEDTEEGRIAQTNCHGILTENLGLHHVAVKFVERLLNDVQQQNRAGWLRACRPKKC